MSGMPLKSDQLKVKKLLTDAIGTLCKNGLSFKSELCVEGLLAVSLDKSEIFVINVKETVRCAIPIDDSPQKDDYAALSSVLNFADLQPDIGEDLSLKTAELNKSLILDLSDKLDTSTDKLESSFQLPVSSYCDFEIQDLSITKDKPIANIIDKLTVFNQADVDAIISGTQTITTDDSDSESDTSNGENDTSNSNSTGLETEDLPSCSAWDSAVDLAQKPLNLSEPMAKKKKLEKKFDCSDCGKSYKTEQTRKKHKCKEKEKQGGGETTVQPLDLTICREDDEDFVDISGSISSNDMFTCICSKSYSGYEQYVKHTAGCTKSKLIPCKSCETCGKNFFSNAGYVKHKKLHAGTYKFSCSICKKGFFDRTHLRAHMDSSHSKVRRYECTNCNRAFYWKHHLKRHLATCGKVKEEASSTTSTAPATNTTELITDENSAWSVSLPVSFTDGTLDSIVDSITSASQTIMVNTLNNAVTVNAISNVITNAEHGV